MIFGGRREQTPMLGLCHIGGGPASVLAKRTVKMLMLYVANLGWIIITISFMDGQHWIGIVGMIELF